MAEWYTRAMVANKPIAAFQTVSSGVEWKTPWACSCYTMLAHGATPTTLGLGSTHGTFTSLWGDAVPCHD